MAYNVYTTSGVYSEKDAPLTGDKARDVQIVLQEDKSGPYFQSGSDYYVLRDDKWVGVDIFGLFDFLLDTGLVLFGRTITNEEYQNLYQQAKVDKKTWHPKERKP